VQFCFQACETWQKKSTQNILTTWLQDFLYNSKKIYIIESAFKWVLLLKWNAWSKIDFDALKKSTQNILTTYLNKYEICKALSLQFSWSFYWDEIVGVRVVFMFRKIRLKIFWLAFKKKIQNFQNWFSYFSIPISAKIEKFGETSVKIFWVPFFVQVFFGILLTSFPFSTSFLVQRSGYRWHLEYLNQELEWRNLLNALKVWRSS